MAKSSGILKNSNKKPPPNQNADFQNCPQTNAANLLRLRITPYKAMNCELTPDNIS